MSATPTPPAGASDKLPAHRLVRTLQDAHEQVAREWPGRQASAETFRAYYERAGRLYEQVAQIDSDHHHEALYWAQQERETAQGFAAQIRASAACHEST
jgi:hypothetical protein